MGSLYALMVGIDDYPPAIGPLRGCRNDIAAAVSTLRARVDPASPLRVRQLLDADATRAGIIAGFREHLGRTGPDDTALFWFSGHGSTVGTPPPLWHVDTSGRSRSLVCADSRRGGVPDLLHRELSLLIAEVAAGGGHVVVVLDRGTSGTPDPSAARSRVAPRLEEPPPPDALLPELRRPPAGAGVRLSIDLDLRDDHVELAACGGVGSAREIAPGGRYRGLFSWALLNAFTRLGATATYRQLLTAARCEVEDHVRDQLPQVLPAGGDLADRAFLGGRVLAPARELTLRSGPDGWEINAGAGHGLDHLEGVVVAVRGGSPARLARIRAVDREHSTVEAVGWRPEPGTTYPVTLSAAPAGATVVAVDDEDALVRMREAVFARVPGGRPAPSLRFVEADRVAIPPLRVTAPAPGTLRILSADGFHVTDDIRDPDDNGAARRAVATLDHIARWRQLKALTNPLSTLGNVSIEVVPAMPGDGLAPQLRPALRRDAAGAVRLAYRSAADWSAPTAYVRIRNQTDRRLYGVLLHLTASFQARANLFVGDYLEPGEVAAAQGGRPVRFALPPGRPPTPGASTTGWLKLIVADHPVDAAALNLPDLGTAPVAWDPLFRSAAPPEWTTTTLPVVTTVPR